MYKFTPLVMKKFFFLLAIVLMSTSLFSNELENKNDLVSLFSVDKVDADNPTFLPITGHAGTVVTLTDLLSAFTDAPTLSTVTLNGVPILPANVKFINAFTLEVTIPCGATSGKFVVDGGLPSSASFTYIEPTVTTVLNNVSYCVGATVPALSLAGTPLLADITIGTLVFKWTNLNTAIGLVLSGTSNNIPTFTALNGTPEPITSTITITPSINGCDGTPVSYDIIVNPLPIISSIADIIDICPGTNVGQIAFTAASPTSVSGTSFTWSRTTEAIGLAPTSGSVSPIPSFTATNATNATILSTFTVTPTFEGCIGTDEIFTVSVLPASNGGTLSSGSTICAGSS